MDFNFTEEQLAIKDTARDFAQNEIAPSAVERDIKAEFPYEIVKKLGEPDFSFVHRSIRTGFQQGPQPATQKARLPLQTC